MSLVKLQLLVGWPYTHFQRSDIVDKHDPADAVHQRVKSMIERFYPADASMESNLGNRQVIVRLDGDGENLDYYDQLWKRMEAAANGKPVT